MHISQPVNTSVRLEKANASHSRSLWNLRNEYTSRIMFRDQSLVPWHKHQTWFKNLLEDPNRFLYVATGSKGEVLGSIRFDPGDDCQQTYGVSINVSPFCRGQGVGSFILKLGISWLQNEVPSARRIAAEIKSINAASIALFVSEGFTRQGAISEGLDLYILSLCWD